MTQTLAEKIYQTSHLTGEFLLRSNVLSNEYFDKYLFESNPELLNEIVIHLIDLIPPDTELLAGLEMGGIPLATMLSYHTKIPCLFVRKKAKEYGTAKLAEGPTFDGRRVTVIEDIVTSGGQVVLSTNELRVRGAIIEHAICVIDRESGGRELLKENGINLHSQFTSSSFRV